METLSDRIKARRAEMEITQTELARRSGISKTYLCEVEKDAKGIGSETLLSLAKVLGVSLDWLMCGRDGDLPADLNSFALDIPADLREFAMSDDTIGLRVIVLLRRLERTVRSHKRRKDRMEWTPGGWQRFYEALKPFI